MTPTILNESIDIRRISGLLMTAMWTDPRIALAVSRFQGSTHETENIVRQGHELSG
jgi:hypothetical protein